MMERALAHLWCDRMSPRPKPAVISVVGVFSTHTRIEMRRAIRHSWLPSVEPANSATHFVLRGLDLDGMAARNIVLEASAWRDLVLVNASSTLPRSIGPTLTFIRWCACAPRLHPTARFIGKYDDDVWGACACVCVCLYDAYISGRHSLHHHVLLSPYSRIEFTSTAVNGLAVSAVLRMVLRAIDGNASSTQPHSVAKPEGRSPRPPQRRYTVPRTTHVHHTVRGALYQRIECTHCAHSAQCACAMRACVCATGEAIVGRLETYHWYFGSTYSLHRLSNLSQNPSIRCHTPLLVTDCSTVREPLHEKRRW